MNLAILIDPVRIAVGGGLVRSWDRIAPAAAERRCSAGPPFPPELVLGRFPYDAPLLGAVALAIDAAAGTGQQEAYHCARSRSSGIPSAREQMARKSGNEHRHLLIPD